MLRVLLWSRLINAQRRGRGDTEQQENTSMSEGAAAVTGSGRSERWVCSEAVKDASGHSITEQFPHCCWAGIVSSGLRSLGPSDRQPL